jgi:hypothetical protein
VGHKHVVQWQTDLMHAAVLAIPSLCHQQTT